jgi:uncharacterized protein
MGCGERSTERRHGGGLLSTRRVFLTAEWRQLLMVSWRVPDRVLVPLVPRGTELDRFDGSAWASIVAFRFLDTRVLGVPVPGHRDFDEVNLRFYVRRQVEGEWRRAAVFVRELVPRRAIAWTARLAYNEPYSALPMRHQFDQSGSDTRLVYQWRRNGRWESVSAVTAGAPQEPGHESLDRFIAEHYWGYTRQRDGGTVEYHVSHPSWRVSPARDVMLDADVSTLYGDAWREILGATPASAFVAEGSRVAVYQPERL